MAVRRHCGDGATGHQRTHFENQDRRFREAPQDVYKDGVKRQDHQRGQDAHRARPRCREEAQQETRLRNHDLAQG